jgi:hypothetical protein
VFRQRDFCRAHPSEEDEKPPAGMKAPGRHHRSQTHFLEKYFIAADACAAIGRVEIQELP